LVSPATRFEAFEENATKSPSALRLGETLTPFASLPALSTLTRVVVPDDRSRRKMSPAPLVSPATRLVASDRKATRRPSALIAGSKLDAFAWSAELATLARVVESASAKRKAGRVASVPRSRTPTVSHRRSWQVEIRSLFSI